MCVRCAGMDDRKNRNVLVSMAAGVSVLNLHNGFPLRASWLPWWIFARPISLSHRDASHFFAVCLDTFPDALYDGVCHYSSFDIFCLPYVGFLRAHRAHRVRRTDYHDRKDGRCERPHDNAHIRKYGSLEESPISAHQGSLQECAEERCFMWCIVRVTADVPREPGVPFLAPTSIGA
jgi:hypothetical protein